MRGGIKLALALSLALSGAASANPTGPTVVSGNVQIQQNGNTLQIQNSTPKSIINWQSFSIAAGETTSFTQPSASSVVLNRVVGSAPSQILGSLQSNGGVYLINASGILFGAGAQVNTASFVATTANVSDASFLAGNPFPGTSPGSTMSVAGDFSVPSGFLNIGPASIDGTGEIRAGGGLAFTTASASGSAGAGSAGQLVTVPEILTAASSGSATSTGSIITVSTGELGILSPGGPGGRTVEASTGGSLKLSTGGSLTLTGTGGSATAFAADGRGLKVLGSAAGTRGPVTLTGGMTATAGAQGGSGSVVTGAPTVQGASIAVRPHGSVPQVARVAVNLQKREPLY